MSLPDCENLTLSRDGSFLTVCFNRPAVKNALSLAMVTELESVLYAIEKDRSIRALILRGTGGHFCAGGDIKDMAKAKQARPEPGGRDPVAALNRRFGSVISALNNTPQTVVAVVEGAAMGGGFGLVCVADVVIVHQDAKLRLPETSLGLPPAQIAPFLVQRLGLSKARRLALTGSRMNGLQAHQEGLADICCKDEAELEEALAAICAQIRRCAPIASAQTKALLMSCGTESLDDLLDRGADLFSRAASSAEGMEGMMSFLQKRQPAWERQG